MIEKIKEILKSFTTGEEFTTLEIAKRYCISMNRHHDSVDLVTVKSSIETFLLEEELIQSSDSKPEKVYLLSEKFLKEQ